MDLSTAISGLDKVANTNEPTTKRRAETIAEKATSAVEDTRECYDDIKEKFEEVRDAFNALEELIEEMESQIERTETAAGELAEADKEDREGAHSELVEAADELHTSLSSFQGDDPPHAALVDAVKELTDLLA